MYGKCNKCDKYVAIDYYIAKSDRKTTWMLLMTYNIVKKNLTQADTQSEYI